MPQVVLEALDGYNRQFRTPVPVQSLESRSSLMKLLLRSSLLTALAFLGLTAALVAQNAAPARTDEAKKTYKAAMEEADQKIAAEVKAHSELMKNLEYLTTEIGARLTGSKQMQQASE